MTSPLEDTLRRAREGQERQSRQIQSGQIVEIDRSTLPWTAIVEFVTAHNEAYRVAGIALDPLISFPDAGAIFVLPRNEGAGAEDGTGAPSIAVEVARGESDEAASITGFHADFELFGGAIFPEARFPGVVLRYRKGNEEPPLFILTPRDFPWTDDGGGGDQNAGLHPGGGSVNIAGREINLFAGKPDDVKETALRVWIEPLPDGGRVNILYGLDPDVTPAAARHVADIPLVHPSAVDGESGKIRTEPSDPPTSDGSSRAQTAPNSGVPHQHDITHDHPMAEHFHEIPILAVRPLRIWYAE